MLKLSLKRNAEAVEIEGYDGSATQTLEIREMTAAARDSYLDRLGERVRLDAAGRPAGLKKFEGMQADLLTLCLWKNDTQVDKKEIQGWPANVTQALFETAQKINHLGEDVKDLTKEGEEAKK